MEDMTGKICLVTGANSGIGKAICEGLAMRGADVIMVARDKERGEAAYEEVKACAHGGRIALTLCDLSLQADIRALAAEVDRDCDRLDVLINNAAIIPRERVETEEGIEMQLAVNHLGYFLLTHLLLPKLEASAPSRIINVASGLHYSGEINLDDLGSTGSYKRYGWRQYSNTKLMNVLFTFELAKRLEDTGVTCNCLHPGVIRTRLTRDTPLASVARRFFKKPHTGAETPLHLACSSEVDGLTGRYFEKNQVKPAKRDAHDPKLRKSLWGISAELTGVG